VLRIREALLPMLAAEADVYTSVLRPELARHGIHLLGCADLTDAQRHPVSRSAPGGHLPRPDGTNYAPISPFATANISGKKTPSR
jgi:hypothetical protein